MSLRERCNFDMYGQEVCDCKNPHGGCCCDSEYPCHYCVSYYHKEAEEDRKKTEYFKKINDEKRKAGKLVTTWTKECFDDMKNFHH